jgi:hypothetical protein
VLKLKLKKSNALELQVIQKEENRGKNQMMMMIMLLKQVMIYSSLASSLISISCFLGDVFMLT